MDCDLKIGVHQSHDRFAVGWDGLHANKKYNYNTYILYLGIPTISLNIS